jgi:hypothetical protein
MHWLSWARPGRRAGLGPAAWNAAGSSRFTGWRWHPRPSDGRLERPCPLQRFCPERERPGHDQASDPDLNSPREAGLGAADLRADWWFGD